MQEFIQVCIQYMTNVDVWLPVSGMLIGLSIMLIKSK